MNNSPMISICIPAYENPKGIERALNSALKQEFADYEIIISDDSGDDKVAAVVRKFVDERIIYVRHTPSGATANWNNAFALAKGKYVTLLHHDDWYSSSGSIGTMIGLLEKSGAAIAFCGTQQVLTSDEKNVDVRLEKKRFITSDEERQLADSWRNLYTGNGIGAPSAVVFRKNELDANNIIWDEELHWLVDIDFYMQLFEKGANYIFTREPLVSIGISENQITRSCETNWELQFSEYMYVYCKFNLKDYDVKYTRKLLDVSNANKTGIRRLIALRNRLPLIFYVMYIRDRLPF